VRDCGSFASASDECLAARAAARTNFFVRAVRDEATFILFSGYCESGGVLDWKTLLGVEKRVVEAVETDDDAGVLLVSVRPTGSMRDRCGTCRRRCPGYDLGGGRRRWRSLDAGTIQVHLEADAPRVSCRVHGVTVAAVPWARHQTGHTVHFDAQVAWLAARTSKSAITVLMLKERPQVFDRRR